RDSNNALRVQTAAVIARIEGVYMETSMQLEVDKQKSPADKDVLLRYARHFDDYAFTGLLDHERERENRLKATNAYRHLINLHPDHADASLGLARIMIRTGQWAEAAVVLEKSLATGQVTPSMLMWYFDVLFHLKRYDDLERTLLAHVDLVVHKGQQPQHILDALNLWCSSCQR
ncbi:MAG: tetratricopeptide repeat protein, partial [Magnetococcus sp. YQC-5]